MNSLPGVIELGGSSRLDFDQAPHYDYAQHNRDDVGPFALTRTNTRVDGNMMWGQGTIHALERGSAVSVGVLVSQQEDGSGPTALLPRYHVKASLRTARYAPRMSLVVAQYNAEVERCIDPVWLQSADGNLIVDTTYVISSYGLGTTEQLCFYIEMAHETNHHPVGGAQIDIRYAGYLSVTTEYIEPPVAGGAL